MRARIFIGLGLVHWTAALGAAVYLGVSVSRTPPAQREAFKLAQDAGLTVRAVATNSPAAAAGLEAEDILTRLDDQWLYATEQLAALLRNRSPGDRLVLERVRQGKTARLEVSLAAVPGDAPAPLVVGVAKVPFNRWQDPAQRKRLLEEILWPRETPSRAPVASPDEETPSPPPALPEPSPMDRESLLATVDAAAEQVIILVRQRPEDVSRPSPPPPAPAASPAAPWIESPVSTVAVAADDVTLLIETVDGRRDVTFLRRDGVVLFRGPIDSPEDQMRLPAALRERALEYFDPVDWTVRSSALPEAIEFHRLDALPAFH